MKNNHKHLNKKEVEPIILVMGETGFITIPFE